MDNGYLEQFLGILDRDGSQQEVFIAASNHLQATRASEYSRVLRAAHVDIGATLSEVDQLPTWKIVDPASRPISAVIRERCCNFVDPDYPHEFSSQMLPQLLLRTASAALPQIRAALASRVVTPSPTMVVDYAESARRVTAAVPVSTGLTIKRDVESVDPIDLPGSRFWSETLSALRFQLTLSEPIRRVQHVSSYDLLRAALGRGADHRISSWFVGMGLGYIELGRADQREAPSDDQTLGFPISAPVARTVEVLMSLAALAQTAPSADRVILASLAVPDTGLSEYARDLFGPSINLPLLYLRSGGPQGLTRDEADWLVSLGDKATSPEPSAITGDVDFARLSRLWTQSDLRPGFDAQSRLAAWIDNGDAFSDGPVVPNASFRTGDALTMSALLSAVASQSAPTPTTQRETSDTNPLREALRSARTLEEGRGNGSDWGYANFAALLGDDARSRLEARQRLTWSQPGPPSLESLGTLGGRCSAEELVDLHAHDPLAAFEATALSHALANGLRTYPTRASDHIVRLFVGGADGRYATGVVTRHRTRVHTFDLDEPSAVRMWADIRSSQARGPAPTVDALRSLANRIGLDRSADDLIDADIEFVATAPFDAFLLDQVVRSVCKPRSLLHRVIGGAPGRWQGSFAALLKAGGDRFVVGDPTGSLKGAEVEAEAIAGVLDAQLIGGPQVLRATVMRTLQESAARPQLLHFAGHGQSGLVHEDGRIGSGVIAADREAVTMDAMTGVTVPRVLVASACDVGAVPPVDEAVGWSTAAISRGAAYSIASGLPVNDIAASIFMITTYGLWRSGHHLESAVAQTVRSGHNPHQLKTSWATQLQDGDLRAAGTDWLLSRTAAEIEFEMGLFLLSTP